MRWAKAHPTEDSAPRFAADIVAGCARTSWQPGTPARKTLAELQRKPLSKGSWQPPQSVFW